MIIHKVILSFLCLTLFIQEYAHHRTVGFHWVKYGQTNLNDLLQDIPGPDWRDGVGVIKSDRLMINPGVELNVCFHF